MSKSLSLLAILAASAHANDTTCGDDPDKVPNCDKPDHGSCGNACCILDMVLRDSPQAVYNQTVAFLKAGGYDGSFAYVPSGDPRGPSLKPLVQARGSIGSSTAALELKQRRSTPRT